MQIPLNREEWAAHNNPFWDESNIKMIDISFILWLNVVI